MIEGLLLAGTLVAGVVAARLALALVLRIRLIDHPNERSSHELPTPRGGGIGPLAALAAGATAGLILLPGPGLLGDAALAGAVAVLAAIGLSDDRKGVGAGIKFLPQAAVGVIVALTVGSVEFVALPGGGVSLGVLAVPLTVLWLAGLSNVYNFMDGIDGIAALHGGLAAALIGALSVYAGGEGTAWLAFPLAGALLAFLSVNWPPAKVFMGDVGSLPLGFLLAALAVLGNEHGKVPFVSSFLILGPFLFDTIYTLGRRAIRRENLLDAHRSHLYQRLVILGWSHRRVTMLYGAWTLLSGWLGFLYLTGGMRIRSVALVSGLLLGVGLSLGVRVLESGHDRKS